MAPHTAEPEKIHVGKLKPYAHEELGREVRQTIPTKGIDFYGILLVAGYLDICSNQSTAVETECLSCKGHCMPQGCRLLTLLMLLLSVASCFCPLPMNVNLIFREVVPRTL